MHFLKLYKVVKSLTKVHVKNSMK